MSTQSILSKISINRNLTISEIEILDNRAKNYTIDDIYLIVPDVWSDYDFEILCYKQAYKDYLMDEYKIYQLIQEIIKYEYETM
jgi:hypothetical protein